MALHQRYFLKTVLINYIAMLIKLCYIILVLQHLYFSNQIHWRSSIMMGKHLVWLSGRKQRPWQNCLSSDYKPIVFTICFRFRREFCFMKGFQLVRYVKYPRSWVHIVFAWRIRVNFMYVDLTCGKFVLILCNVNIIRVVTMHR